MALTTISLLPLGVPLLQVNDCSSYFAEIHCWYLEQDLVAGFFLVKKSSKKTKIRPNGGGVNVRHCCIHSSITPFVWLSVGPN